MKFVKMLVVFFLIFLASPTGATPIAAPPDFLEQMQKQILAVSKEVNVSVVHIEAILKVENMSVATTGSGFIFNTQGHILTNHHVVEKAEKVTVTLPGFKKKFPAEIIGTDQQTDLAVLKIQGAGTLKPPKLADSAKVQVGDWVIAIGNPYGLDGTVSFGIISAVQRNIPAAGLLNEFIQTDAMIDFGSSGGPLVNMKGEVIGVNSRGQGRGIGFTIPMNLARDIGQKLILAGQVERSWLGVTIQPFDRDLAEYLKLPKVTGVLINQVHEGSAAERAGLKPGDILAEFDGQVLEAEDDQEMRAVTRTISQTPVNKKVRLMIVRDKKTKALETTMLRQPKLEGMEEESDLGFQVEEITKILFINERLTTRSGVYVSFVEPGSVADEAKLQKGDVIIKIDTTSINNIKDFQKNGMYLKGKPRTLLNVMRGQNLFYVLLKNDRKKPRTVGHLDFEK